MKKQQVPWSRKCIQTVLAATLAVGAIPAAGAESVTAGQTALPAAAQPTPVPAQAASVAAAQTQVPMLNTNITREQAIAIAQKAVAVPKDFTGPQTSSRRWYDPSRRMVWEIRWEKRSEPYGYIEVTIDANTGRVLEFNHSDANRATVNFPPKITYEQAIAKAKTFLQTLYPQEAASYEVNDRDWKRMLTRRPFDYYYVTFLPRVNGVSVPEQSISVRVTGNGQVVGFHAEPFDHVKFQEKTGILPEADALQKVSGQLNMKLAYDVKRTGGVYGQTAPAETREMVLTYVPELTTSWFDAKTGEPINYDGNPFKLTEPSDKPLAEKPAGEPPAKRSHPLSEQEALDIFSRFAQLPADVAVTSIDKQERNFSGDMGSFWHIQLEYQYEHGTMGWTGGIINAETGAVTHFDIGEYWIEKQGGWEALERQSDEKPPAVSFERAQEKAITFVKEHAKDKLHQLYLGAVEPDQEKEGRLPYYEFSFMRKVNGIEVPLDNVRVAVSKQTGEVVRYDENWNWDKKFPEAKNTITPEQAKASYLRDASLTLEYKLIENRKTATQTADQEARLVYRLEFPWNEPVYLDAQTGKMISIETGKEPQRADGKQPQYADLKGHPAEKELMLLLQTKALAPDTDNKVYPNKIVTRGEFVSFFVKTVRPFPDDLEYLYSRYGIKEPTFTDVAKDSPYFGAVEYATQQGWIDKATRTFAPDRPITREEAARIVVSALGYDKLADRAKLFNLPYSDKDQITYKGHVAIAGELGFMSGIGGKFQPKGQLTRAQAAVIIYRFLEKQNEYAPTSRLN